VRHYSQNHATFYSDLFPYADSQNFVARDQDLAAQINNTIGFKATYAFLPDGWKIFKRGTATLDISHIQFKYSDFRDIKYYNDTPAGGNYAPGRRASLQLRRHRVPDLPVDVLLIRAEQAAPPTPAGSAPAPR
jgi:hypothetical protein